MSDGQVLPWQLDAWSRLRTARDAGRMPHALLMAGPRGVGKRSFAIALGRALVCRADPGQAPSCMSCRDCQQYDARTQPNASWIEPAEAGKAIPVDAVRELSERLGLTADGTKVVVIQPADALTVSAANSLLKTLEEPSGDTIIMLITAWAARIPATLRSRCQRVGFGLPAPEQAREWLVGQGLEDPDAWLARAAGAPLRALELAAEGQIRQDDAIADALLQTLEHGRAPMEALTTGEGVPLSITVPALIATAQDLIRLALDPREPRLHRPEYRVRMAEIAARMDARALFDYLDALYRAMPATSDSLRPDMQFHGLLADAAEAAARR